jgi:thiamine biosynthesis lipoprotein
MGLLRTIQGKVVVVICVVIAVLLSVVIIQKYRLKPLKQTEMIMGTLVEITVIPANEKAIREAFEALKKVDALMSTYKEDSEISILNREGKAQVSEETLEVIEDAIKFSNLTDGAFDITCRPLINLWKKAKKEEKVPTEEEIEEAISLVGYQRIILEGNQIRLEKKGMQIDLGGIAKGYAVDKAIEALKKNNIKRALVNAGGDLYALGTDRQGEKWQIGVQDPREEDKIIDIIKVKDRAVATSGDYRRYFTLEGKRFSHIVNPKTGLTVQDVPMSVTIVGPGATTTDALSTGVFVLGPEEGMKLIESLPEVEGMIISEGMKKLTSQGWEKFVE